MTRAIVASWSNEKYNDRFKTTQRTPSKHGGAVSDPVYAKYSEGLIVTGPEAPNNALSSANGGWSSRTTTLHEQVQKGVR